MNIGLHVIMVEIVHRTTDVADSYSEKHILSVVYAVLNSKNLLDDVILRGII